jgi:hypothetical protein
MNAMMPDRRGLFRGALAVAAVGAMSRSEAEAQQQTEVRWSVGTEPPKSKAPSNATDCHFHIYDPKSGSWMIACVGRIGRTVGDGHIAASAFTSPYG